jgi:hypothetical protein
MRQITPFIHKTIGSKIIAIGFASFLLSGCLNNSGPAVTVLPQTISFSSAPSLNFLGTATVSSKTSSGLAPGYSSTTPTVCSVDTSTGLVTDLTPGSCIIAANQSGNSEFAPAAQISQSISVISNPAQTINFGAVPALTQYSHAIVTATASSGLEVTYSSLTPNVCAVDSVKGDVTDLNAGVCTIAADQAGNSSYDAAPQVTQSITVASWSGSAAVPNAPSGVEATLANTANTVTISFIGPTSSGGSPISGYTVTSNSNPTVIITTGATSPIMVTCPTSCSGYSFNVIATNNTGNSLPSLQVDILTHYNVTETFYEPMTQPNNTIFTGSFTLDSTTNTVTNLTGYLTESMTGTPMALVPLAYQLSAVSDGYGGLLVTTFALNTSNTFYGGGFAPGSGSGIYFGYPAASNPDSGGIGNAYAIIDINISNPTLALTQNQINKLAYADCTKLGMMGATCMTGTSLAAYGTAGSMSGYPLAQVITKK